MIRQTVYAICLSLWASTFTFAQQIALSDVSDAVLSDISVAQLTSQLDEASATSSIYFHAKDIPVNIKLSQFKPLQDGYYFKIANQNLALRVFLNIQGFYKGDTLFILDRLGNRKEYVCSENLNQNQWSSSLYHHELYLYYKNQNNSKPEVEILSYSIEAIKEAQNTEDFLDSEWCEVNVRCSEGNNFQQVKNSVVRVLIKNGATYSWCTGNLLNNTAGDCRLLMHTAEHCGLKGGNFVSSTDMNQWVFYFNYESTTCINPTNENQVKYVAVTGAHLLARSDDQGGDTGSDFILMELNSSLPASITPYFMGWDRSTTGPTSGVVIHQPQGDIKKISTYTNPAVSGSYAGTVSGTHWLVNWATTANGQGVTEGGSSGSALLNANGLFTGSLTGGAATCSNPSGLDYFGKLSFSWVSNGTSKVNQMKPWLDPIGSGVTVLEGSLCNDTTPVPVVDPIEVNPTLLTTTSSIFISGGTATDEIDIQIYDVSAKLVQSTSFQPTPGTPTEIFLENAANGVYFVRIKQNLITSTVRIVIAK